jgi:hypothetical protein
MARTLHIRLDDASAEALETIRGDALTESEAVAAALHEAAGRRRARAALREEAEQLAGDAHDREEMRVVREQMAELAPRSNA